MATLERTYIIPLRKKVNLSPDYKKAKKAVNTVRAFLEKHMKSNDVKLGEQLNLLLWERGIKNPPGKVKVTVEKDDKGVVRAELFGHKYIEKKKVEKKEKSKLEQLKEKMLGKEEEHNKEAIEHVETKDHKDHTHSARDSTKELQSSEKKEIKASRGKEKAQHKELN